MCGIVGIAGDLWFKEEEAMRRLLVLDYFRGPDSTGLAAIRNNDLVKIAKIASDPITLFQSEKFKDALNGNQSKLFLGHNRASTSGVTSNFNAHPFHYGDIVGVHNGTLELKDKPVLEEAVGEKFGVDSQALIAAIDKLGIKETIELISEGKDSAKGAWAIVWYDLKDGTLNFLRNRHRPLWYAWDKGFKRLFFASQWHVLDHLAATHSSGYELEKYENKEGKTYRFMSVPENMHMRFDIAEIKKGSSEKPKPKVREIKGKEPSTTSGTPNRTLWDPFPKKEERSNLGVHTTSSTTRCRSSSSGEDNVIHLYASERAPYAGALTEQRFYELVQRYNPELEGFCSWCHRDIAFGDPGITVYDQQDTILCSKCSGHKEMDTVIPAAKIYAAPTDFDNMKRLIHA